MIAELGGVADDNWHDSPIGTGLTRFRFGPQELTVFADAWSLGVTTIPAVIVDRHYVVYGDPDAAHAVTRIQAYREAHP